MQTRFFPNIETDIFLFFPFWKKNRSPFFCGKRGESGTEIQPLLFSRLPPLPPFLGSRGFSGSSKGKKTLLPVIFLPNTFSFLKKKFAKKRKENGLKSAPSQKRFCCRVNFCKGEEKEEKIAMHQRKKSVSACDSLYCNGSDHGHETQHLFSLLFLFFFTSFLFALRRATEEKSTYVLALYARTALPSEREEGRRKEKSKLLQSSVL